MQLFAADDFSRRLYQMHFFLGALWVNLLASATASWMLSKINLFLMHNQPTRSANYQKLRH